MKSSFLKFSAFLLLGALILLILPCSLAYAETELASSQKLKNKALVNAIKKTDYASWTLYGPCDSEIVGKNIYSTSYFKNGLTFPVVAVKGDKTALLIMQRTNKKWTLLYANENALVHDDFILDGFSIDPSSYDSEFPSILATFDFASKSYPSDYHYCCSLYMWINGKDKFSGLYLHQTDQDLQPLTGRFGYAIDFLDESLLYQCDHPDSTLTDLTYLFTPNPVDTSLANFNLSAVPLLPSELMLESEIHTPDASPINFYLQPDLQSNLIGTIPDLATVLIADEPVTENDMTWYLVQYENNLGYVLSSQIVREE